MFRPTDLLRGVISGFVFLTLACGNGLFAAESEIPLIMVVMDPLAAPLSCPCVKGYAQRDYAQLASYLERELGRPVKVVFNESLYTAATQKTDGKADIVIGKRSVVVAEAVAAELSVRPVMALTGKDGATTQTGLIVVPDKDPAKKVADLKDYRIIFGPAECDEKHAAALSLLKKNGVTVSGKLETCAACSDGATTILEAGADVRAATVISSYAAPLLEGCGTIKKGDLRVVGTTEPVPFVVAFVSSKLPAAEQSAIETALAGVKNEPALLLAIESKTGFVRESPATPTQKKPAVTQRVEQKAGQ
jgi:ABC-type phosphate/phosphonate transport system substrate-binding protein